MSENKPLNDVPVKDAGESFSANTLAGYASRLDFNIGTHIVELLRDTNPQRQRASDLLKSEYQGMMLDFDVEWLMLEPEQEQYKFGAFDAYVAYARSNGFKLHYSHLLWLGNRSSGLPNWVFTDPATNDCGTRRADELELILLNHIHTVIQHDTSGTIVSWNVVNEGFDEDGQLRDNCLSQLLGPGYIDRAFQYAREATPNGTLVLNEYFQSDTEASGINLKKVDGFFDFVEAAKANGVPIDAVGIQNHLFAANGNYFGRDYLDAFRYILDRARRAGVKAMITEMDVYQGTHTQEDVRRVYQDTLAACLQDSNCVWFCTWGISDAQTWLHRSDTLADAKPLLFDESYQRKPAYYGVLQALEQAVPRK